MTNYDKKTSSLGFRRKLKKFTETVKHMRDLNKIPRAQKLKGSATEQEKDAHAKMHAFVPDTSTIMYFCVAMEGGSQRYIAQKPVTAAEETSDSPTFAPQML